MKKYTRLPIFCLSLLSTPLLISPIAASAQSGYHGSYYHGYDNGYDDGYDDGYEDAMDDCPCPPRLFLGGFYAGAGIGYEGFQFNRNPWITGDYIGSFNTHLNGWNGRLFGGYGRFWDRYYLGGEAFLGTSGASGKDTINLPMLQYNGKVSAGTSWGVSVLPGYRFDNGPLTYARFGYVQTQFKVTDTSGSLSSSSTNWTSGFQTGIGVEIPLFKNISGRLEYDYINYNSFNNNGSIGSKNSPRDNRGSLDFVYHF